MVIALAGGTVANPMSAWQRKAEAVPRTSSGPLLARRFNFVSFGLRCGHPREERYGSGHAPPDVGFLGKAPFWKWLVRPSCRHPSARDRRRETGHRPRLLSGVSRLPSDIDLLRDLDGIVDLDAEITDSAFDLRVTEQELHGSKVTRPPVDQHGFGTSQ